MLLSRQERKLIAIGDGVDFEPIENYVGNDQCASYRWEWVEDKEILLTGGYWVRRTTIHQVNPKHLLAVV